MLNILYSEVYWGKIVLVGRKKENNLKNKSKSVYMITQKLRKMVYGIINEKREQKKITEYLQICSVYCKQEVDPIFQILIPNLNLKNCENFFFGSFSNFSQLDSSFLINLFVSTSLVYSSPSSPVYFDYFSFVTELLGKNDSKSYHLSLSLMVKNIFIFYFLFIFIYFYLFFILFLIF